MLGPHDFALLSEGDRQRLAGYEALPRDARMLALRLLTRSGSAARRSTLTYAEIGDIDAALARLVDCGFAVAGVDAVTALGCNDALRRYAVAELDEAAKQRGVATRGRKAELIERLAADRTAADFLATRDPLVWLALAPLFARLIVLFFGNRAQDLSSFIISDLEHLRYPDYIVQRDPPLFVSRDHFEAYIEASIRAETEVAELDEDATREALRASVERIRRPPPAPHRRQVDPAQLESAFALEAARRLERLGAVSEALSAYEALARHAPDSSLRSKAADRLGIVGARCGQSYRFAAIHTDLDAAPDLDSVSRYRLQTRAHRLGLAPDPDAQLRRATEVSVTLPRVASEDARPKYRGPDGEDARVEAAALAALGPGLRSENLLVRCLFGLLLWDVVFAPVAGAFQHPFQGGPLDFYSAHFATARANALAQRLERLRGAELGSEVDSAWDAHVGEAAWWVRWDIFSREALSQAASLLGPRFVDVLAWLARHPKRHGRGFPDLLVWPEAEPVFVEVKSPGDQMRLEQRLCHDVLLRAGFDVRIARVAHPDDLAPTADSPSDGAPPASRAPRSDA